MKLTDLQIICNTRTDQLYHNYLKFPVYPSDKLQEALIYGILNGGKQLRPLLVYATGLALGAQLENLDAPACAIEFIHGYSLIHDDLPAMDNADLRRGKPSCHKKFGEAMAILTGDALQALASQIIALHPCELTAQQRVSMIAILSTASGAAGMAGGQALDISEKVTNINSLTTLYSLKTGALISAGIKLGAAAADETNHHLEKFADYLGLAFQIQDDVLDIESDTSTLGKPQGIDVINEKITYPTLIGIEKSKQKVQELIDSALATIDYLGPKGESLRELAAYILRRRQ